MFSFKPAKHSVPRKKEPLIPPLPKGLDISELKAMQIEWISRATLLPRSIILGDDNEQSSKKHS